ncbi:MAG: T9SS type A sorting domain-containing protein, partial [Bacteroidetes bacterium]
TVTASTSNSSTASACDSYTWSQNGMTYTASGTYTDVVGCHTEELVLTITASTSNSTTVSACDSYTWSQNGMTYTASGTYTDVVGCHTEELVLTVTATSSNSTNVTGCGSYMWSENGMTYTTSGTYSNTVGCHTETIVLTINNVVVTATASGAIQCFGGMVAVNVSATGGTAPYSGTGSIMQAAGTVTNTVTDDAGCTGTATVTLSEPTKVEGTTTTTPANCGSTDGSATVTASGGAGGYTYLWSDGASQTTATASGLGTGTYTVTITDANGCTGTASASITGVGGQPDDAGSISGPSGACRNTCVTYTVPPISGATSYNWTLPAGATGTSSTNSITVCFDNTYAGGFLCVEGENTCGIGVSSCINIPVLTVRPAQPGFIVGNPNPCGPTVETYSIPPSANATSYTWSVTGAGVAILTGQGTNTVQVSFPAGFGQAVIGVYASNCKGNTSTRSTTLTGIPTHSSPLTGPGYVCAGTTGVPYSISAAIGAGSSYVWSTTGDITVASAQGSTSIIMDFGASFTTGTISVTTSSSCGSFTRSYTIRSTPGQPGSIAGPSSNLCGQTGVTYSIAPVFTATSYLWTVPAGVTMTTPNGGTSITLDFTPAFTGTGNICVTSISACGSSIARCYSVTALTAAPSTPAGPSSVCKSDASVVYTLTPVAGATSYLWSVSGGASIAPSGTSATVNFNSATSTTAVITMNAVNACGYSQPGKKFVSVNLGCRNASGLSSSVEFNAYPNPTMGLLNVSFQAEKSAKYIVKVVDLLGNVVISDVINASEGANLQELNLSKVAKGLYLLSIETDGEIAQTLRVVVE